jgi:predicted membrane protein
MTLLVTEVQPVNSVASSSIEDLLTQENVTMALMILAVVVVIAFIIGRIREKTENSSVFNTFIAIIIFVATVALIYYSSQTSFIVGNESGEVVQEVPKADE